MTASITVTITCDLESCGHWFMGDTAETLVTKVRDTGRRCGWKHERRSYRWVDICPIHDAIRAYQRDHPDEADDAIHSIVYNQLSHAGRIDR